MQRVIACELPAAASLARTCCFLLILAEVSTAGAAVSATVGSATKVLREEDAAVAVAAAAAADVVDRGRHQRYKLGSLLHARHNRSAPSQLPDSLSSRTAGAAKQQQQRLSSVRTRAAEAGKTPQWPFNYQTARVSGDIMLGGLMMVHERHEQDTCGRVMWQGGLQATEAMLYTLDEVNRRDIIKGVTLGARIKDDCDRDIYGLEQSFDFIEEYVSRKAGVSGCSEGSSQLIAGVVGASSSVTSIQVANLLKLFSIPQVSFFSTSSELSNKDRYPFFVRTIPSDKNQAEAMVAMVLRLKWTYVSIVYEESSYGEKGKQELERLLAEKNVCIATTVSLIKDSGVAAAGAYDKVAKDLSKVNKDTNAVFARGVIVFASDQEVNQMMQAIRRNNLTGTFSWIGSDGWGARKNAYEGNEPEVEGAITFQPYAEPIEGFEDYFLNLTPETNVRNPWFTEYWEDYFKCRVPGSLDTPYNKNYTTLCRGDERQNMTAGYEPEGQLQFVSNAVMAFAYALRILQIEFCGKHYRGLCPQWAETNRSGQLLLDRLKNVSFTGLAGGEFHFLPNGDAAPKYRILNFKRTSPTNYSWVTVGTYDDSNNLTIDDKALRFTYGHPTHPSSRCSNPCSYNQAKHYYGKDKCCWMCIPCAEFSYLRSETACEPCENGTLPHPDLTHCVPIPEDYLTYNSSIAMIVMTIAALGVVVTSFVIAVFIRHQATPVVRAAGRELTFVLLGGILGCYLMTFIIISRPSFVTCGVQRFGNGFCFSVCYSALLTKTNRIARIFRAGKRTIKRPNFISPMSQLVICAALIALQVFIGIAWLLWHPPEATHYYPTRLDNQLLCKSLLGLGSMVGLFYPMVLIVICTVYAVQTRKIPEAFNESKYIGFTMYTTSIIWLAFVAIFVGTVNNIKIRLATTCITMSLSASVALACLFTPKLYIILLRPDRNVRQSMMASKVTATTSTAVKVKTNSSPSSPRLDSCHLSDGDMELHQRLKRSPSVSSGVSRNTIGTQTQQPAGVASNMSTQTLDVPPSAHRIAYMMDIQL